MLTDLLIGKSVNEFIVYFEKKWINGNWSPKISNYFKYIGRKTYNYLKIFNKLGKKSLDHKIAFINNKITIADYLYAYAANIDYIEYADPDEYLNQVYEVDDILNHDQYQLDLAESMGPMLNENSVSLTDSNEASTSSIVASAIDDEFCLVCGELARTGS